LEKASAVLGDKEDTPEKSKKFFKDNFQFNFCEIFKSLITSLLYLHKNLICHFDIKLPNIFEMQF
jgi:hypothetical protein